MSILRKIFGAKQRSQEELLQKAISGANGVVNDYGDFMQSSAFPIPGFIADTKKLPHEKETIKSAIILCLKLCEDSKMKEMLKAAYISLADFQNDVGETDVGFDFRTGIDFNDKTQLHAIAQKLTEMKPFYDKFSKQAEDERQSLLKDISKF